MNVVRIVRFWRSNGTTVRDAYDYQCESLDMFRQLCGVCDEQQWCKTRQMWVMVVAEYVD